MTLGVTIPIRVKVDPCSLLQRQGCIEDALSEAVTRALRNSGEVVLSARDGLVGVKINPPSFVWTGDIAKVPNTIRAATERLICLVLARAIQATGIPDSAVTLRKAAQPLSEDTSEQLDRVRYGPLLRRYRIPKYHGAPDDLAVDVDTSAESSEGAPDEFTQDRIGFKRLEIDWDDDTFFFELIDAIGLPPDHPALGSAGGRIGLLFSASDGGYWIVCFQVPDPRKVKIVVDNVTGYSKPTNLIKLDPMMRLKTPYSYGVTLSKQAIQVTEFGKEEPFRLADEYCLRWLPASTSAERRAIREKHIRKTLPQFLEAERQRLQLVLSDGEFAALVTQAVSDAVSSIEDDPSVKGFCTLEAGDSEWLIWLHVESPEWVKRGSLVILPRTEYVPKSKIGKGTGDQAGEDKGDAGTEARTDQSRRRSDIDCKDNFTDHSALNPEQYLPDTDFYQTCRALLGEPSLDQLDADGQAFQARIDALAGRVGLPACRFAGNFCLGAGQVIARRARELGDYAATEEASGVIRPSNQGNLGFIQFEPQATKAIQDLQALARLMDDALELSDGVYNLYRSYWNQICGRWYQYVSGWGLAFDVLFKPIKDEAIGNLFIATCRVLLLQLLEASHSQISARKVNIKTYAPVFNFIFRAYFTQRSELEKLKARLQLAVFVPRGPVAPPSGSWLALSSSLVDELGKGKAIATDALKIQDDLVFNGDELIGIRDEHDNIWTKDALEQALSQREFLVESIDPLIKQFSDREAEFIIRLLNQKTVSSELIAASVWGAGDLEPALIRRLAGEKEINTERVVVSILDTMLDRNDQQTRKVRSDYRYAFETAPLHEDSAKSHIPYCGFVLQGIHKLADEQIGGAFELHPNVYGWILNDLLSAEAGKGELLFAGLTLLAVLCPPLGAVGGIVAAVVAYDKALEKKALFRSLIDPDLIMTRAEVEAELFVAELGLALAFIPEAKTILGGAAKGIEVVAEQGVRKSARAVAGYVRRGFTREGLKTAADAIRRRFAAQVAEQLKEGLIEATIKALAINEVMDFFLSKLLVEPVLNAIDEEFKDYAQGAHGPGVVTVLFGRSSDEPTGGPGGRQ